MIIKKLIILSVLLFTCYKCNDTKLDAKVVIAKANEGESVEQKVLLKAIKKIVKVHDKDTALELIALLPKVSDWSIASEIIFTLGKLRSEQAVQALINYSERKPTFIRQQIILTLKEIASEKALAWLFVMANGYDDLNVRKEAQIAFDEIENAVLGRL